MTFYTIALHAGMILSWLCLALWSAVRCLHSRRPGWLFFSVGFLFGCVHCIVIFVVMAGRLPWGHWETVATPVGMTICFFAGMMATRGETWCAVCPWHIWAEEQKREQLGQHGPPESPK